MNATSLHVQLLAFIDAKKRQPSIKVAALTHVVRGQRFPNLE